MACGEAGGGRQRHRRCPDARCFSRTAARYCRLEARGLYTYKLKLAYTYTLSTGYSPLTMLALASRRAAAAAAASSTSGKLALSVGRWDDDERCLREYCEHVSGGLPPWCVCIGCAAVMVSVALSWPLGVPVPVPCPSVCLVESSPPPPSPPQPLHVHQACVRRCFDPPWWAARFRKAEGLGLLLFPSIPWLACQVR
jgi:hypothetical protein